MGKAIVMFAPIIFLLLGSIWYFAKSTTKTVVQAVQEDPNRNEHLKSGLGGLLIGTFLGSFVGVAAFGGAIAGTIPGAIIGALVGYLASKGSTKV